MPVNRIKFRDRGGGNTYTVPINPATVSINVSSDLEIERTPDGSSIMQKSGYNQNVHRMLWDSGRNSDSIFTAMVTELKTYKDAQKELYLNDIDVHHWGYKDIRVTNVETNIIGGKGTLEYTLALEFILEEPL